MTRGKSICSVLKTIRKQVADAYICHGPVPWQPVPWQPKDAELVNSKEIKGATWHFFESPVTGKIGPSKPLRDELIKNNIKIEIHK